MSATGKSWRGLGCAAVCGALVGFAGGLAFAGRESAPEVRPVAGKVDGEGGGQAKTRNVYSPDISNDPYVLGQQRKVVEALEAECRNYRTHCAEAEQARRWMSERDAAD